MRSSLFKWLGPLVLGSIAITLVTTDGFAKPKKKKPATEQPQASGQGTSEGTSPTRQPRRRNRRNGTGTEAAPQREGRHVARGNSPTQPVREGVLPPALSGVGCPGSEMALIDSRFCIDRWEGSLVEVVPGGGERQWSPFDQIPAGVTVKAVSAPNVMPQAYISGAQAESACKASGKRLCNPTEWRTACKGPERATWGYGNQRVANRCNDHGQSPMYHYYPQVKVSWRTVGMVEMNDPKLNQWAGTLARTGSNSDCTNEYGVFDMVGNVHEWTDDPNGTFQGGWYLDTTINGDGCEYRTNVHEYTYHDYSTGFRCCSDPRAIEADEWPPAATGATNASMMRSDRAGMLSPMAVGSWWFPPSPSVWAGSAIGEW